MTQNETIGDPIEKQSKTLGAKMQILQQERDMRMIGEGCLEKKQRVSAKRKATLMSEPPLGSGREAL